MEGEWNRDRLDWLHKRTRAMCVTARAEGGQHMKRKISASPSALVREIEELQEATSANLKERWRALYRSEPPRRISRDLLIRALAYRIQEKALGGLKPSTRRLLTKVAADASARRPIQVAPEPSLVFNGKQYKSLSQVAYRITGTKWSGPLFFGLKANRQEQTNGAI